jgi:hypothetical protein
MREVETMKSQDDAECITMRDHLRLGVLESLGGLLLGLPLGFLGVQLGRWLGNQSGPANSWRDLVGAIAGGAGGYLLGVAAGMSFVRRRNVGSGSFWIAACLPSSRSASWGWIATALVCHTCSLCLPPCVRWSPCTAGCHGAARLPPHPDRCAGSNPLSWLRRLSARHEKRAVPDHVTN